MMLPAGKKRVGSAGPSREARKHVGRRELLRSFAALYLATACGPPASGTSGAAPPASTRAPPVAGRVGRLLEGPVELWSWFDLPDDPRSRELSGIAWDAATKTLWGVQDETAHVVPLRPDPDLRTWALGAVTPLKMTFPLDLEGIVVLPDGFIVASEVGPRVLEVDRHGRLRRDLALPAHFAQARPNKSLESLTMSPDGAYLFTTTEVALTCDGASPTTKAGTRVRILRMSRTGTDFTEHAYVTDPAPHETGDYGVADLAALSPEELLVLERGWTQGAGNTARIYRTSIADPITSCLGAPELAESVPTAKKTLLVDLAKLAVTALPALPTLRQKQDSPLLDNFEGMALGPLLRDGRQTVILVSDDNARTDQFARIVVLAIG